MLLPAVFRLGAANVAYVAWYRLSLKMGIRTRRLPRGGPYDGSPVFRPAAPRSDFPEEWRQKLLQEADRIRSGQLPFFSFHWFKPGDPPDWFLNPISGERFNRSGRPWTEIDEFAPGGDIKIAWEPSRFQWVLTLARGYVATGNQEYLDTINRWIDDWIERNPFNLGLNWKCGQECAIRLAHLLTAAFLMGQHLNPSRKLVQFVYEHALRIESDICYSLAQKNNHGTSAAMALWLAGAWLQRVAGAQPGLPQRAKRWERKGRAMLENLLLRLVERDGTFSQYSVNYHRVLLDTVSLALFWRRLLDLPPFSERVMARVESAWRWLVQLVDHDSGKAPNTGANDGALLFRLHSCEYVDFRPSIQLAAALIRGTKTYAPGPWNEPLYWFNMPLNDGRRDIPEQRSRQLDDGGFVIIRGVRSWAFLRYPKFRFRPAHCDCMHLDLWYKGENMLRDGGTYMYNCEQPWLDYFPSVQAHNTIQFDGHDQMPRISRFLYGKWIAARVEVPLRASGGRAVWQASYRDPWNCFHRRKIEMRDDCWRVTDVIRGYRRQAVLRWRLVPGDWTLLGNKVVGGGMEISIASDHPVSLALQEGWESRYYAQKSPLPVFTATVLPENAEIVTEIKFPA
jgi:hypothetical protein